MVMEASPSPQSVGREFVRQYYTLLNKAPDHLHRFYNNHSSFVHGGLDAPNRETLPVVGQKQIHNRIQQLNFRDCHAKISQVDAQATLGSGVVVQVTGELSNGGAPMRRFTQTFVLAAQSPKKYYVHNDIFRYQDIVFSDEEGSGSGRSEGEEEEAGGGATGAYFPPPPGAFPPTAFPAPPPAPLPSPPPAPLAPTAHHLNGHPPLAPLPHAAPPAHAPLAAPAMPPAHAAHPAHPVHDDTARHLVAALQGANISGGIVEREAEADVTVSGGGGGEPAPLEPESEPEREPEPATPPPAPQPQTAAPPMSTEPKTYANLLKSGGGSANAVSGPSPPTAAAPALAPQEPRGPRSGRVREPPAPGQTGAGGTGAGGARYPDAQQLFLGNLPHSATEEELRALFARYGPVAELRVHSKPAAPGAPRHPNYGFITYETAHAAHECLNAAPLYFPSEGAEGAGVKLNVEEKKTRGRDPPRRRPLSSHRAFPRAPYRR